MTSELYQRLNNATRAISLNSSQVLILKALAASESGLTRAQIAEQVGAGVSVNPANLGPATDTDSAGEDYPDSLMGLGLVKAQYAPSDSESRGGRTTVLHATAKGQRLAEKVATRNRPSAVLRIPAEKLDPLVKKMKAVRTYGLELFTDTDLTEIKNELGKEFFYLTLTDLRIQIVNRRKQRAYVDENACRQRALKRIIKEFGPEGNYLPGFLTPSQLITLTAELDS